MTRINKNNKQIKEKIKLLTEKLSKYGLKEREDHKGKKHSYIELIWIDQSRKDFIIFVNTIKKPRKDSRIYQSKNVITNNMYEYGLPYFETSFHYIFRENR